MEKIHLGELLKENREKKRLSIDDVARATRIRKEFLEALENEDYTKLPERTYALGYFRSYAKFLEIENVEDLVVTLDKTYFFERPEYSSQQGQIFLDDEYGLVNTIKKKITRVSQEEKPKGKGKNLEQKHNSSEKEGDNPNTKELSKTSKKQNLEEGGFSSQNKLIIILCVFLFIFLFLGYKLIFNDSSSKDNGDSKEVATNESSDDKKIDSIIKDNYVVVENNDKLQTPPAEQKSSQNSQDSSTKGESKSSSQNEVNENNLPKTTDEVNQAKEESQEEKKVEIKYTAWPKPTRNYQISIAFAEDVWVQIYKQDDPSIIYLDRIFKAGDIYDIPKVDNIAMRVGNYKGVKILVDSKEITLTSRRKVSVVLNDIILEKDSLLDKYPLTSRN